ncbi:hypothetical protein R3P38DRAFT_2638165 [Favolaschia claudopus]|uniref:Integrase core domain-containing protein n=1 Tax=Favolaschia claudopus TaxID=2862362 RepID=A0AAW0APX8_9AGAR
MVNTAGNNGHYNGTRPPDDVLEAALHRYSRNSLSLAQRLDYLVKDFNYKIGLTTLKGLNRKFNVDTVKKPPPEHISATIIGEVISDNASSRKGPGTVQTQIAREHGVKIPRDTVRRLMADLDPGGAEIRYPGRNRTPKQRGHLTDTGVYYEVHFDGHEKLNFKALRMGRVGIDIYGSRCHSSSRMIKFLTVPNARCSSTVGHYYLDLVEDNGVFVQATVDGGSETGELYAAHLALRQKCMPDVSLEGHPAFVALPSTDNIPIEASWKLFTNYVGLDIKEILLLGRTLNYFNAAYDVHVNLFNWLWPKIIQLCLDDFVDYWNNHRIRLQKDKVLPSGFSPNYICDFPERFGLVKFGEQAPQEYIDQLRQNIPKSREECYRWVSDEFDTQAAEVYEQIGSPKLKLTDGWTIFCRMLPLLL